MNRVERLFLGAIAVISLIFLIWGMRTLSYTDKVAFGAGFIPINAAALLVILCLYRFFQPKKQKELDEVAVEETAEEPEDRNIFGLILTVGLLLAAVIAMHFGSLLIPLAIVMVLISKFVMGNTLKQSVTVTAITLLVIYAIFSVWLNLPIR